MTWSVQRAAAFLAVPAPVWGSTRCGGASGGRPAAVRRAVGDCGRLPVPLGRTRITAAALPYRRSWGLHPRANARSGNDSDGGDTNGGGGGGGGGGLCDSGNGGPVEATLAAAASRLAAAVAAQDYRTAAAIRDAIAATRRAHPELAAADALAAALAAEDYRAAAAARDALDAAALARATSVGVASAAPADPGAGSGDAAVARSVTGLPRFALGTLFRHRRYGYRGVIFGADPSCKAGDDWARAMGIDGLPRGRSQPFYHVLVDERDRPASVGICYVAEENVGIAPTLTVVQHPLVETLFEGLEEGEGGARRYRPGTKLTGGGGVAAVAVVAMLGAKRVEDE
ncbi:hypothetical protein MMPV_003451 [Pyropia vietnamensis]